MPGWLTPELLGHACTVGGVLLLVVVATLWTSPEDYDQ